MKLTGMSPEQLTKAKNSVGPVWQKAHEKVKTIHGFDAYKKMMQYGFLGTIDILIATVDENGVLDTDGVLETRKEETGFRQDVFERAVDYLADNWPNIAAAVAQIG